MSQSELAELVIIGAGTYGAVIAELAADCGFQVIRFLDDDASKLDTTLEALPVRGPVDTFLGAMPTASNVAVAIGNNVVRLRYLRLAQAMGHSTPSLVSPRAVVSPSADIGEGSYLHAAAHVWTRATLGMGTIMSPHSSVAHHSTMGEGCFVSTDAHVGASIDVGSRAFFGMGSTISTGIRHVAADSVIGAGAVIIRNTEPRGVYAGVPGRLLRIGVPE